MKEYLAYFFWNYFRLDQFPPKNIRLFEQNSRPLLSLNLQCRQTMGYLHEKIWQVDTNLYNLWTRRHCLACHRLYQQTAVL